MVELADKQGASTKKRPRGKPWKKGQSGNPNGRPKNDICITAMQREELSKPCRFYPHLTWAEYLKERGLIQAGEHWQALEKFKDRIEGPVVQPHTLEAEVGGEIVLSFERRDAQG